MDVKIDLKSPVEERIKAINGITSRAVLEALLLKDPNSKEETILKEWEITKAVIKARIDQLSESETIVSASLPTKKSAKKASNILALISLVITAMYLLFLISYISSTYAEATADIQTWEGLGTAIGTAIGIQLAAPHMVIVFIAFIFNIVTAITRKGWAALTSGILYAVSMLLMPVWLVFVTAQTVLCFVQFAKIRKAAE